MTRMRTRLLLSTATIGTALGAIGLVAAARISGPQRPTISYAMSPFEIGVEVEDVFFEAADGTRLAGWWFDNPGSERVVVISHGHRGSKADLLGIGPGLWRAGNSVLLYDFRGNGDSQDGPQSLAHYEQADLRAAIDFVTTRRPAAEVDLVGFSMGAATSIMVAATDERVRKVVADSSFADVKGVVANAFAGLHLPPVPFVALADGMTRARYGYRFGQVQPVDVVGRIAPRPLLLMHCAGDRIIPVDHAHRLAAAAGEGAEVQVWPTGEHCGGYFADRPGYIARVAEFLARH